MVRGRDGSLCFASLHPRSQKGPTVFATRDSAEFAIKATNAYDKRCNFGWDKEFGKLWIMPCDCEDDTGRN